MSAAREQTAETILGAIVTAVAIGFLAFAVARAGTAKAPGGYELWARFQRVDGVNVGADVRVSGVKVGAVEKISIDTDTYFARVSMSIDPKVKLPDDSSARVASDGLLGGAYVSLEPGGSETFLGKGAEIPNTQGSVDLLSLFSAFANGGGKESGGTETQEGAAP